MSEDLQAAVAAGVLGAEEAFRALLQSVVEVARAIFGAKASSIFLLDEEADELVFEAVAGEGADSLLGQRFPSSTGHRRLGARHAPAARASRTSTEDPRFAKDVAESTGYVPKGLMAVPLLHEERALGVLEVLDRPQRSQFTLDEMDLLGLFANQAAIALDLLQRARRARGGARGDRGWRGRRRARWRRCREARGRAARGRASSCSAALDEVLKTRRGRLAPPSETRRSFVAAS